MMRFKVVNLWREAPFWVIHRRFWFDVELHPGYSALLTLCGYTLVVW